MVFRKTIDFVKTNSPILEPITKFGGQPNWLEGSQWPISKVLNIPMRFICQIELTEDLFHGCSGKMAYVFMTDDEGYVDGTWEPDGGENAVIIQPNGKPQANVQNITIGPSLQNYVEIEGRDRLQPIDVELAVNLAVAEDPEFIEETQRFEMTEADSKKYSDTLSGNKIGGTPGFLQGDEFPDNETDWQLLMQLDSCGLPFSVNFGDSGIAYAFINRDGSKGKFLWQCC
ncbi:MAG: DUF1963 domain-containing protein [Undibacterium sp.]|nr:DUF1963 domain-containing protein [Undibacterium sp.]